MFFSTLALIGILCLPPTMEEITSLTFKECTAIDPGSLLCMGSNGSAIGIKLPVGDVVYVDNKPENLSEPIWYRETQGDCVWKKKYAQGYEPKEQ